MGKEDTEIKKDELLAKSVKTIQDKVDGLEEKLDKSNEEVLKTSEFKSFQEKIDVDIQKLDEGIKTLKAPPMSEQEIEKKEYDNFGEQVRLAGMLNAKGTKFTKDEVDSVKLFMGSEEKMMQVNNDIRAGYLQLPPEFIVEIIDQLSHEYSPVRSVARRFTTSSNRIQIPSKTARGVASWTAEAGTITEDETLTFGLEDIPVHDGTALATVSYQMLRDSAFNLPAYLRQEYLEAWAVLEGTAFVNGTGIGQPEGFMINADVASVNSENATAVTADSLYDTYFTLKEKYTRNAVWGMRRITLGSIAAFKGGDGQYLINRLPDSPTFMLLGSDILEMADMPLQGAGLEPVVFGDFNAGYAIVDNVGAGINITDPYSNKATGQIDYLFGFSTGGQVINAEALKTITCAVT